MDTFCHLLWPLFLFFSHLCNFAIVTITSICHVHSVSMLYICNHKEFASMIIWKRYLRNYSSSKAIYNWQIKRIDCKSCNVLQPSNFFFFMACAVITIIFFFSVSYYIDKCSFSGLCVSRNRTHHHEFTGCKY